MKILKNKVKENARITVSATVNLYAKCRGGEGAAAALAASRRAPGTTFRQSGIRVILLGLRFLATRTLTTTKQADDSPPTPHS